MKSNKSNISCKRGFTLIELLVVVLIIGILAAVAVPQYQFAVDKARLIRLLPLLRDVKNAQEMYYLVNGRYATTWEELNYELPSFLLVKGDWAYSYNSPGGKNLRISLYGGREYMGLGPYSPDFLFIWGYDHTGMSSAGRLDCYAYNEYAQKLRKKICTYDGSRWVYRP